MLEHSEQFAGHSEQTTSVTNLAFETGFESSVELVVDSSSESGVSVGDCVGAAVADAIGDAVGENEGEAVGMLHWYSHTFPSSSYPLKHSVHLFISLSHLAQLEFAQAWHTPPTAPVPGGHLVVHVLLYK